MQSNFTGYVKPAEWRWTIVVASVFVLIAFAPLLWIILWGFSDRQWQFMGALHIYNNTALDLSQVVQGIQGHWLMQSYYTPEMHNGAFVTPIYAWLGHIARIASLSPFVIFHVARSGAAMFMYMALYQLGATIWTRVRTRRVFFLLVSISSGFGWLLTPLLQNETFLDVINPQAFPFFSTLVNVHLPLAIGAAVLLANAIIVAFRPGQQDDIRFTTKLSLGLLSLLLVLMGPVAFFPMAVALCLVSAIQWANNHKLAPTQVNLILWIIIPVIPLLVYDAAVLHYNLVFAEIWSQQGNGTPASPLVFVLSLGLPLIIAIPGLYRAFRRFESDGNQYMLLWLLAMVVMAYLPFGLHERVVLGAMVPVGYFATRAIEDFWFNYLRRRWRMRLLVGVIPILAAGHLFVLFLPIRPIAAGDYGRTAGVLLEEDYVRAFDWLRSQVRREDVVLAAPTVSVWIPVWVRAKVVYGHPDATAQAREKRQAVERWFRLSDGAECSALLQGSVHLDDLPYHVRYVIVGPQELRLGAADCVQSLTLVRSFDRVRIYQS